MCESHWHGKYRKPFGIENIDGVPIIRVGDITIYNSDETKNEKIIACIKKPQFCHENWAVIKLLMRMRKKDLHVHNST